METVTVEGVQPRKCFTFSFIYTKASAGERLQGKWTSNYAINFYVMSESDYARYRYCGRPESSYLTVEWQTSYSLDWVVPQDGPVRFIFENYAQGTDMSVERIVTFTLYKVGPLAIASTLYTTVAIPSVDTTTVTLTSISYSTLPSSMLAGANWITLSLLAAVVLGAIVLAFLLTRRTRLATAKESRPSGAETIVEKVFCINCGAELPARSKFCNKCGSSQQ
jgi:ribosomal protein L40E